jgi:hypothetical protein
MSKKNLFTSSFLIITLLNLNLLLNSSNAQSPASSNQVTTELNVQDLPDQNNNGSKNLLAKKPAIENNQPKKSDNHKDKITLENIANDTSHVHQKLVNNDKNIKTVSLDEVIKSAIKNYPKILSHYDKIRSLESDLLASKGFFDIRLKQNYSAKTRGYYDGKTYDAEIEKYLGVLGSKVYSGYRKSYGKFAEYDGQQLTNSQGEFRAGAKFSLLKDRDIDDNRLAIILGNLGVEEGKIELENIKMEIVRDATKAYWSWVTSGRILQIYEDLYQLSLNRQKQLQARAKQGDIAEIVVVENRKNLLKRKASLVKIRQEFESNCLYLSLFYRDEESKPIVTTLANLAKIPLTLPKPPNEKEFKNSQELALNKRPEIRLLKIKNDEESNKLKLAKNSLQPQLDVEVGASKDQGLGPTSRSQANNYANITMSMPLQLREARGKVGSSEAKISALKYQRSLLEDQIKVEIDQILVKVLMINETHQLLNEEVKLAEILQNSEVEKFKHGASNFFLVNIREQDLASSKAALAEVYKEYQNSLADYKLAVFDNKDIVELK